MRITQNTLRQIIKEELDAVMQEGPLDMLRNLGRKKKTAAPAEPELTCAEVRQKYNEIAPETTYGTIGDNAEAMQRQLIKNNPGCFTAQEKEIAESDPAKLVTGDGPMNEEKPEDREARIDRAIADARKKGHIGNAFDVRQNRSFFDQDPERDAATAARVARLKGKMNEADRDPRPQAVGLVQAIKAELDTANTMGTSADPGRMMKLLNQLEQAIERI